MIRCNSCGTNNIDGSEYCDECGMKLDIHVQPLSHRPAYQPPSAVPSEPVPMNSAGDGKPLMPPSFTTSTSIPKPALPARRQGEAAPRPGNAPGAWNDAGVPNHNVVERRAVEPARREVIQPEPPQSYVAASRQDQLAARAAARLVIERGGRIGKEFSITGIETNIGRWDADSGIFPDIDLDEDDPEAKISRRHARILNHNGQFYIEDLGSTNGTFINRGRRLLPGKRHTLQNGDEVIVGKTFLKFHILM